MILNKPSFSISFSFEDCVSTIESIIKSHGWTNFEVGDVKLVYTPYWIFSYDAFLESTEKGKEKFISDTSSSKMALNSHTGELNQDIPSLLEFNPVHNVRKPDEKYEFEVVTPLISKNEVQKIAPIKLASQLQVPKDNIVISALQELFVPVWILQIKVAEGVYRFEVNAVSGDIINEQEIPEREKSWIEVTNETLSELQSPGAWIKYSSEIFGETFKSVPKPSLSSNQNLLSLFSSQKRILIILLVILLILILLWNYGYIKI